MLLPMYVLEAGCDWNRSHMAGLEPWGTPRYKTIRTEAKVTLKIRTGHPGLTA